MRGAKSDYLRYCLIQHYVYLDMIGSLISRNTKSCFQVDAEGLGFALLHEREENVIFYLFGFVLFNLFCSLVMISKQNSNAEGKERQ